MATQTNTLLLAVDQILASKTNPRKTFDDDSMRELIESVKVHGVLQPVLVRPIAKKNGHTHELVVGERRWRAAKAAKLEKIPAVVRELPDHEARELQIIENVQRKDVHPLEAALGYRDLLALKGEDKKPLYDLKRLAERIGKSQSYVYQALKLADLTEAAQKKFREGGFTTGHAILIARLLPADQAAALKWMANWQDPPTVRSLKAWIFQQLMRSLDKAPFEKDNATYKPAEGKLSTPAKTLNPAAEGDTLPACTVCPFRAANARPLYADLDDKECGDTCTNAPCYEAKITINLRRKQQELHVKHPNAVVISRDTSAGIKTFRSEADRKRLAGVVAADQYEEVKSTAKEAVPALVVDGPDRGRVTYIVPSKKEEKRSEGPNPVTMRENLEADIERATWIGGLEALTKAIKVDDFVIAELAAFCLAHGLDSNTRAKLLGDKFKDAYGEPEIRKRLSGSTRAQFLGCIAVGVYGAEANSLHSEHADLKRALQHFDIDLKEIGRKVRKTPEFQQREARIKALEKSKAAKAKNGKAKTGGNGKAARKRERALQGTSNVEKLKKQIAARSASRKTATPAKRSARVQTAAKKR